MNKNRLFSFVYLAGIQFTLYSLSPTAMADDSICQQDWPDSVPYLRCDYRDLPKKVVIENREVDIVEGTVCIASSKSTDPDKQRFVIKVVETIDTNESEDDYLRVDTHHVFQIDRTKNTNRRLLLVERKFPIDSYNPQNPEELTVGTRSTRFCLNKKRMTATFKMKFWHKTKWGIPYSRRRVKLDCKWMNESDPEAGASQAWPL